MAPPIRPLAPEQLRWKTSSLDCECPATPDVRLDDPPSFQPTARQALQHALAHPHLHVFVQGPEGSGRLDLIRQELARGPAQTSLTDFGYVHNFRQPESPRLLSFPAGQGRQFRKRLNQFSEFVEDQLHDVLSGDPLRSRRQAMQRSLESRIRKITEPLEKELEEKGMTLVRVQNGPVSDFMIFPTVMDRPVPPEQMQELVEQGQISQEFCDQFFADRARHEDQLKKVDSRARAAWRKGLAEMETFRRREAGRLLSRYTGDLFEPFKDAKVRSWLKDLIEDVLERHAPRSGIVEPPDGRLYEINLVHLADDPEEPPVMTEASPDMASLAGTPVANASPDQPAFQTLRVGRLIAATGGCLILRARDLLAEPSGLTTLLRSLRNGQITPTADSNRNQGSGCSPDSIPLNLRVVLVGDAEEYRQLSNQFPDFRQVFRLLADFDSTLPRDSDGLAIYAHMAARLIRDRDLLPASASGVAALVEEGSGRSQVTDGLSARFDWMADRLLEADRLARSDKEKEISRGHVETARDLDRQRSELPLATRVQRLTDRDPAMTVRGRVVGQCNGFWPLEDSPETFLPGRMTASTGPGRDYSIRIREQPDPVLPGLLNHLVMPDFLPCLDARLDRVAGPLPGDDQGGGLAGFLCLVSALSGLSLRQDLAVVGFLDQQGHVLPVKGINECIRNFYRACQAIGTTGEQGVIIPRANVTELAIDGEVEKACRNNRFFVYPVDNALQALELASGQPAGARIEGAYPADSTIGKLVERLRAFHELARTVQSV